MPKARILHIAPANTSGVPGQFVQTERELGYESRLVTLFADPRNYFQDICLNLPLIDFAPTRFVKRFVSHPAKLTVTNIAPRPKEIPIQWKPHTVVEQWLVDLRDRLWRGTIRRAVKQHRLDQFDIYQLDGGLGLYRSGAFIQRLHAAGKKIICCYTGSDLRVRGVIPQIDAVADLNVSVEFDHLLLHPNIQHVFFPFDASKFKLALPKDNGTIYIGHAPTNRAAKGSAIIIPIVKELEKKYPVKLVLIENLRYKKALELKAHCHIFIDQIGDLGYGISGLESLAMGIPTCSCLAPGFDELYPDNPFMVIDEKNLKQRKEFVFPGLLKSPITSPENKLLFFTKLLKQINP